LISIGHSLLHLPQPIHLFFLFGPTLISENRDGSFITSETGQNILQNARFFLKANASIIPIM